jgi:hypothetical protein
VPLAVGTVLLCVFRDDRETKQRILEDLVLPADRSD